MYKLERTCTVFADNIRGSLPRALQERYDSRAGSFTVFRRFGDAWISGAVGAPIVFHCITVPVFCLLDNGAHEQFKTSEAYVRAVSTARHIGVAGTLQQKRQLIVQLQQFVRLAYAATAEEFRKQADALSAYLLETEAGQFGIGVGAGGLAGAAPGGFIVGIVGDATGAANSFPRAFRMGYGVGEAFWGLTQIIGGLLGDVGGGILIGAGATATAMGVGSPAGVPMVVGGAGAIAASTAVVAEGAADVAAGARVFMSAASSPPDPKRGTGGSRSTGTERPKRITNPKHHPNSQSPEPKNVQELFDRSTPDAKGVRWAKDENGTIHRFSAPSNGESHWNGSTAGSDGIRPDNVPTEIRRALR